MVKVKFLKTCLAPSYANRECNVTRLIGWLRSIDISLYSLTSNLLAVMFSFVKHFINQDSVEERHFESGDSGLPSRQAVVGNYFFSFGQV